MKPLLTLISLLLNFAISAAASPEKAAALSLYTKITGIQVAAQRYSTAHSYSNSGITMSALCTYQNISGVCGKNNDGFYQTG